MKFALAWVRVASGAQSRQGAHWEAVSRLTETARRKRRVPGARHPIYAQNKNYR